MLEDKVYLITGAASGIGAHLVSVFLARGAKVTACDINEKALEGKRRDEWSDNPNLLIAPLDVTDAVKWSLVFEKTKERFGRIDGLLNVAGYLRPGWIMDVDAIEIDRHFDINVKGTIHGSRLVARIFKEQGHGQIVNLASMSALAPIPGIGLYSASKFAIRAFSLIQAQELRPHGIKVTVICPDAVETPMLKMQESYEEAAMTFSAPKMLTVEDVEKAVFHALSKGPLEICLPQSRGLLAKLGNFFPGLSALLGPVLNRSGQKKQQRRNKS